MNIAKLSYGPADEVAEMLTVANDVTQGDLTAALFNAMSRIDTLEKQMKKLVEILGKAAK